MRHHQCARAKTYVLWYLGAGAWALVTRAKADVYEKALATQMQWPARSLPDLRHSAVSHRCARGRGSPSRLLYLPALPMGYRY
jgi:hypothetical protein